MAVIHRGNGGVTQSLLAVDSPLLATPEPLIIYPGVLRPGFSVTVIGDVRIDVMSRVRTRRFAQLTHNHGEAARVAIVVGGTAMSFARAAAPHFGEVRVIAAIGDDQWSDIILRAAGELGVLAYFGQQPGVPNGLVMIVRDAGTPENPGGVRLMLAQKPSPRRAARARAAGCHRQLRRPRHRRIRAATRLLRRRRRGHPDCDGRRRAGQLRPGTAHDRPAGSSRAARTVPGPGIDQDR